MNIQPSRIVRIILVYLLCMLSAAVFANTPITVGESEPGDQKTGHARVLHDPQGDLDLSQVLSALKAGEFSPLTSAGSTGLKTGAYWSHFELRNPSAQPRTLHLEYVDHQLIHLDAFSRPRNDGDFTTVASLSMERPFAHRLIEHNRFVVPLTLAGNETREVLVRFGSRESGYAFPSMRIWSPQQLEAQQLQETALIGFLFGGFLLMAMFALIAGVVSRKVLFFVYSAYALSKISCWATILGYTHQFVLRDQFHWSLMSISGALTILLGLTFARMFLQTRQYVRRLDYVILFMMANAGLLLIASMFQIKIIALVTITLALLLYPVVIVAGLIRWRQGLTEAGIFSLAWSFLVMGLFVQAFRDLGVVEHTLFNYYWPPVTSFSEMLTIMFAMGFQVRRVYQDRKSTERKYWEHLELSKSRLEAEVRVRTRELEQAKRVAELEARTDALTGILNRRSFLHDASLRLKLAQRKQKPSCLFMIDLDHFKRINDTCGHGTGDAVLCKFTNTISQSIRVTDVFGRLGGEEFGLLVEEPEDSALALAERLRSEIASIEILTGNEVEPLRLTASIGLAFTEGAASIDDLLKLADEAMYQAKMDGRNRVIGAETSGL